MDIVTRNALDILEHRLDKLEENDKIIITKNTKELCISVLKGKVRGADDETIYIESDGHISYY